jgi:hypothetical protein
MAACERVERAREDCDSLHENKGSEKIKNEKLRIENRSVQANLFLRMQAAPSEQKSLKIVAEYSEPGFLNVTGNVPE